MAGRRVENGAAAMRGGGGSEVRWRAWLVPLFVVANVAMFIITMYVNNCPANQRLFADRNKCVARFLGRLSFQPLRENPLFGPSANALRKMGALSWSDVINRHEGWRLVSCIWLHGGLIHIVINMICLVIIGIRLEQQFGFVRIGPIYLLSGFGGSILSALFSRNSISVGASGALFGLLGAMLSELITNWTIYSNKVAALLSLLVIILINLAVGILPQVDNFAHIGGFLTGFLLGFVLLMRPRFGWKERHELPVEARVKSKYMVYQIILLIISLILVIAGFAVGLVLLYRKVNPRDHCSWCRYLSCVPTSRWECPD